MLEDWFKITIHRLVQMTKRVSSKYTRSKVRKALPHDFSYVIEELIIEKRNSRTKASHITKLSIRLSGSAGHRNVLLRSAT